MTVEEKMEALLMKDGMFETQTKSVIAAAKESELFKDSGLRWGSEADGPDGYPEVVMVTTWISVRSVAKDWIEENCPKAWFKPTFADA